MHHPGHAHWTRIARPSAQAIGLTQERRRVVRPGRTGVLPTNPGPGRATAARRSQEGGPRWRAAARPALCPTGHDERRNSRWRPVLAFIANVNDDRLRPAGGARALAGPGCAGRLAPACPERRQCDPRQRRDGPSGRTKSRTRRGAPAAGRRLRRTAATWRSCFSQSSFTSHSDFSGSSSAGSPQDHPGLLKSDRSTSTRSGPSAQRWAQNKEYG